MSDPLTPTDPLPIRAESQQQSIQALIELSYVQTANQMVLQTMDNLSNKLIVSRDILDTLSDLQTLHNRLSVQSPGQFDLSGNTGNLNDYQSAASAFFGQPIVPVVDSGVDADYSNLLSKLTSLHATLVAMNPDQVTDPNSLASRTQKVIDDMNSVTAQQWILDRYSAVNTASAAQAGLYQQNLTFAITAAESLNDSDKEKVRRFMYIFEEYYKSASAILRQIHEIIGKMAQGVRGA